MDVGKEREHERKLEGDYFRPTPHSCPLPEGEGVPVLGLVIASNPQLHNNGVVVALIV